MLNIYQFYKSTNLIGFTAALIFLSAAACSQESVTVKEYRNVTSGAEQFDSYVALLKDKRVGVITNVTGVIGNLSIVDTLIKLNVNVKKIFGPEHGFRSNSDAGEKVKTNRDAKTGLPIVSLYGSNKKPTKDQLRDLDVLVYDIQDIGVRFYTYISTMCYAMEACAENKKEFMVLDRPNPNGFYIDGPVLNQKFTSFLGLHPVPLVYGMTCGEYARMANAEGWLRKHVQCSLTVIPLKNYDRDASYRLPIKPSPNIPNEQAVLLYPSLGLFEGTLVSLGRGTNFPFQVIGHPAFPDTAFSFVPVTTAISKEPKYKDQRCYGFDLRKETYLEEHPKKINLSWIMTMYAGLKRDDFFDDNFNYHAGNTQLQEQIKNHWTETAIRKSWEKDLEAFKLIRKNYLLYPDFQ